MSPTQLMLLADEPPRAHVTAESFVRPPDIPPDLFEVIADDEKAQVSTEDGGYMGVVSSGPWKCHYFTTWDQEGRPLSTYDKTAHGWVKRAGPNPRHERGRADDNQQKEQTT